MERVLVSVIIPAYNAESCIERCILNAISQEFKEKEIIVVDDGSHDGTARKAEEIATNYRGVNVIKTLHHCQGAARNRGIKEASGDYILFLDADDYLKEGALERLYRTASELKTDLLTFDCERTPVISESPFANRTELVPGNQIYTGKSFWNRFHDQGGVYYSAPLHFTDRAFLTRNSLFFEEDIYYEDNDWTLRAYIAADRVAYLPERLYIAEGRADSTTNRTPEPRTVISVFRIQEILREMLVRGEYGKNMIYNVAEQNRLRLEKMGDSFWGENTKKSFDEAFDLFRNRMSAASDEGVFDMDCLFLETAGRTASAHGLNGSKEAAADTESRIISCFYGFLGRGSVAIWGTGEICSSFIRWCRDRGSEIPDNIIFIETSPDSDIFMGHKLIAAKEADWDRIDMIVLAVSARNRMEIIKNIPDEQCYKIRQVHPLLLNGKLSYDREGTE